MRAAAALFLTRVLLAAPGELLHIRVVQGENAVHRTGSRGAPGLVLEITDELGTPMPGAVVSIRLPDDGPGGSFLSGLLSEIATTGADGRITASTVRWNRLAGPFEIRVTAMKDRRRAGTVVVQHLSDTAATAGARALGGRRKWLVIGVAVAGAAAVGFAGGRAARGGPPSGAAVPAAEPVEIGAPSITIGKP
jgi:hypothetical protein